MEKGSINQLQKASKQQLTKFSKEVIIKELPQHEVLFVIAAHLTSIAKLYQIPNWDDNNAAILASWILNNYKYEQLETVTKILENPPRVSSERVWRLTPDVIQSWFMAALDSVAARTEKEIHNAKFQDEEIQSEHEDERLTEWLKEIEKAESPFYKKAPMTDEDILAEGKERPKNPRHPFATMEQIVMSDLRVKYANECTDLHTGKVNPGMPSFDEWILTQK